MYKQDESLTFFIYVYLFFHKKGMVKKLTLDEREDASFVSSVAKSLFADGTTNWGRVVSLMAFGAVVSQYLKEKGRGHCVEQVGQEISTYLLTEQRDWLVKNNSWVSCYGSCLNDRMFEKKKRTGCITALIVQLRPTCPVRIRLCPCASSLDLLLTSFLLYLLFPGWLC